MNIPPYGSGAARAAAPAAAFPISTPPTPGVKETPDHPIPDLQLAPDDGASSSPTLVTAKPVASLPALPQTLGLKEPQKIALRALAAGHGPEAAARLARVDPATLFRWRKHDARFIAAFNAWRAQSQQNAHDKLLTASQYAAETVLQAAQKGDVRASLTLLKGLGTLAPRRVGPQLPQVVDKQLAIEASLIKTSFASAPKKVSLHLIEQLFENMDLDDETRAAYRDAFARHRAALAARPPGPLLRPVTPESLKQAAVQMQPAPGRPFKYAAEPSLREYKRYLEQLEREAQGNAEPQEEQSAVPAWLQTPATPVYPPETYTLTITAVVCPDSEALAQNVADADGIRLEEALAKLKSLPHRLKNSSPLKYIEEHAREWESLGATVEIHPIIDPEGDEKIREKERAEREKRAAPAKRSKKTDEMSLSMFNKVLDDLFPAK